ncbi:uncharacterized protein LOC122853049 [Aphidius gifuensis]|nr:uncharacterized protein LOC122853049 [Aphidius gifuensis]
MTSCCGAAVILIAIFSSIFYLTTPYYEPTISDVGWAAWYAAKDTVTSVVDKFLGSGHVKDPTLNCQEWKDDSGSSIYCFTHKKPHENDFMFSYAGCAACVFLLFGVLSNNKLLVLLGFLGKLAVDIAWPMMIINDKYDSSSFGIYFIQHLTSREAIPSLWFFHICVKSISCIVILSFISTMSSKNAPRRSPNYNYVP